MPGIWIARLARRLTRPDTFDRLVSPAIADLQLEAQQGWWGRWRHYPMLAFVIVFALFSDLLGDLARVFDAEAIRVVWSRTAAWAFAAAVINVAVKYALLSNAPGTWPGDDAEHRVAYARTSLRPAGGCVSPMTEPGIWIASAARRLLHRDTFERMVSPAIADLQVEVHSGS